METRCNFSIRRKVLLSSVSLGRSSVTWIQYHYVILHNFQKKGKNKTQQKGGRKRETVFKDTEGKQREEVENQLNLGS